MEVSWWLEEVSISIGVPLIGVWKFVFISLFSIPSDKICIVLLLSSGSLWTFFNWSAGKESACSAGDRVRSIPGLGKSPGEGKGYPLQYSDLENSMGCIGSPRSHKELDTTEWLSLSEAGERKVVTSAPKPSQSEGSRTGKGHVIAGGNLSSFPLESFWTF